MGRGSDPNSSSPNPKNGRLRGLSGCDPLRLLRRERYDVVAVAPVRADAVREQVVQRVGDGCPEDGVQCDERCECHALSLAGLAAEKKLSVPRGAA